MPPPESPTPTQSLAATLLNRVASLHPALAEARLSNAIRRNLPGLMQANAIPGVQIAFAIADRPAISHCRGLCNSDSGPPIAPRTRWRAASLAKPVAAIIALRLHELGRFDLDAPAPQALRPFLPAAPPQALAAITPRLLLSHRAGLAGTLSPQLPFTHAAATNEDALRGTLGPAIVPTLTHAPGEHTLYCGAGYMLLQHLIEAALAQPFADLAREYCFDPLGLAHTAFDPAAHRDPTLITAHDPRPLAPSWSPSTAATGLVTTAHDLVTIFAALLRSARGQPTPLNLSQPSAQAILTPHPADASFTLGLQLFRGTDPRTLVHSGILTGLRSIITLIPRRGVVFAGVANGEAAIKVLGPLSGLAQNLAHA